MSYARHSFLRSITKLICFTGANMSSDTNQYTPLFQNNANENEGTQTDGEMPRKYVVNKVAVPMYTTEAGPIATRSATSLTTEHRKGTSEKERGFFFCGQWGCKFCPLLKKTGTIKCTTTQIRHQCIKKITCMSSILIYAITCKRCNLQYVGQTLLRLRDRFTGHFNRC